MRRERRRKRIAAKPRTKRQPEGGGLRPETGDGLHRNQLIKDEKLSGLKVGK